MITISPIGLAVCLLVVAVLVGIGITMMRRRHSASLKDRFGSEYDRAVHSTGNTVKAETMLHEREKRVAQFDIRPLTTEARGRFVERWRAVQSRFVDSPADAVSHADVLLGEVMEARGYPVVDFEQRSADLSVDHGHVVENYRTAHTIAERHARGEAGTEDLRQAMIHYRALFDDLVNEPHGEADVIANRDGRVHDLRKAPATKETLRD
ncbi:hypothetical protein I5E68_04225 [Novosphingobium sp. YJ-S2-02]|uniref:Secreted protein n=1 Tax=Novosphingobium aureum TaxID=2792964 RepID=A0A931HA32_9SPHN|nr:hypothetical protein [Novosphingobium aureum]MBH0112160.1 hypothetical protein [Novosphingobium aureum]